MSDDAHICQPSDKKIQSLIRVSLHSSPVFPHWNDLGFQQIAQQADVRDHNDKFEIIISKAAVKRDQNYNPGESGDIDRGRNCTNKSCAER